MSASTQRRIERAALSLFAQKGFAATGIRELAEAAGLSTATLYHYMGAKEDLLVAITAQAAERLLRGGRQVVADAPATPPAQLAALVQLHTLFHVRQPLEGIVLAVETRSLPARERRRVLAVQETYERIWTDVLAAGAEESAFRIGDARLTRLALADMAGGVARWYSPRGPLPLAEAVQGLADLALAAVHATGAGGEPLTSAALGLAGDDWIAYLRRLESRVGAELAAGRSWRR